MTIYFTSDLHFSHQRIRDFCPKFRDYASTEEMDEGLIAWWNGHVGPEDEVYNLGDFCFSRKLDRIRAILQRLNGRHHLIYGNHDEVIRKNHRLLLNEFKADGQPLLAIARDYLTLRLPEPAMQLHLFHYPVQEWDGMGHGSYLLHGHIHNGLAPLPGRILNVGFDLHGRFLTAVDIQNYLGHIQPPPFSSGSVIFKDAKGEALVILIERQIKALNR